MTDIVNHPRARHLSPPQDHAYGPRVHLLGDEVSLLLLARLCSEQVGQPQFNEIVRILYGQLLFATLATAFPTRRQRLPTRMHPDHPEAVLEGHWLDPATRVVVVDIARAGIVPSQVCFDLCNVLLEPDGVRQDHLIMSRRTNDHGAVVGADIAGGKVGGSIDGCHVLFPDPMGATGRSLAHAIRHYRTHHGNEPTAILALNLIVTPEYLRTMLDADPDVQIFAMRVDRGMSNEEVLATTPGVRWDEESGLNERDYIIPGGGGFGELMNNSWV
ncbi:MAG: uracil phosphoribosyltransferase [Deltaproteobacteria bacterium]|nr:MAG: uracil phosphoribosyltransferase [Deltaproteobacteria bacterium]